MDEAEPQEQQPIEAEEESQQEAPPQEEDPAPVEGQTGRSEAIATSQGGLSRGGAATGEISAEEINAFRTSITARRFPGLRNLSDEDVAVMLLGHLKAGGAKAEVRQKNFPKSQQQKGEKKSRSDPVWWPNNAQEAKDSIVLEPEKAFAGMFSPYDADRQDFLEKKHADTAKLVTPAPFVPTNWSEARKTTEVDYFINSATAAEKEMHKRGLRERANFNTSEFQRVYTTRRGKKLT